MSWYTQLFFGFLTLISAPIGVKILESALASFKKWYNERRERKITTSENQQELETLRAMKEIDLSKIRRDDFQTIRDTLAEITSSAVKRAQESEAKNELLSKKLDGHGEKIDALDAEVKSCKLIREQMEIDERLMYDTFNIAYWEVTPDGRVSGNATFLRLTGLAVGNCHNDGWFEAIEESARQRCRNFWEAFIANHQTRPAIPFSFRNAQTGDVTHTTVFCGARMRSIVEVYKYTARTKPLLLSPSMTIPEDAPATPLLQLSA